MKKLFQKIDKWLLLHHPLFWSTKLHVLAIWWIPGFILFCGIFALTSPADYSYDDGRLAVPWLVFMAIAAAVIWLIYMLRFNVIKQFGKRVPLDELRHFVYVFIGMLMISLIPRSMEIGRYIRVTYTHSRASLLNALEATEKLQILRLGPFIEPHSICKTNYLNDAEYKKDLAATRKDAAYETSDTISGCISFGIYRYHTDLLNTRYHYGLDNRNDEVRSVKELMTEVTELKKRGADTMKIYNEVSNSYRKLGNFPYDGAYIAANYKNFVFNWDYSLYSDDYNSNANESVEMKNTKRIFKVVTLSLQNTRIFEGYNLDVQLRFLFYPAFYLTLLVLIFRNTTRKTFLISLGVGMLLPLVVAMLMVITGGFNSADRVFAIMFLIYLVTFIASMAILRATRRNIFHGIALNLFTLSSPLLGVFLASWMLTSNWNYNNYLSKLEFAEITGLVIFMFLLQPVFKNLYVRWYSLPEE